MNIPHIISRRSVILALLISLLLHISMVLYVALEKSGFQLPFLQKQENLEQLPQEKKYKKDTEWAETKGRSSHGAPVLFRDEPDDEIIPASDESCDFVTDEQDNATDKHTINENQLTEQSNNQPETHKATPKNGQEKETTHTEAPVEEKLDIKQDITSIQTVAPQQKLLENKPSSPKTTQNTSQATRQKNLTTTTSRTGRPIAMTKQIPSLAQLTQGVLNYVKDEGQYAVSMIGKKGGVPSDEQMKYERFLQKLSHCLQTSFSINNDRFPQCDPSVSSIEIFLALNKDGTLHNLRLAKTSGDPRVDSFMMFAFRDASSSFPTVPHYLPHNPFSITYVIDISPIRSNMSIYRR